MAMAWERRVLVAVLMGCALAACGGSPPKEDAGDHKKDSGMVLPDTSVEDSGKPPLDGGMEAGLTCEQPIPLMAGVTVNSSTPSSGVPSTVCLPSNAPQRFFSLTIPTGQRAVITVTPAASLRAVLRVLERCDADHCIAADESAQPGASITRRVDNFEGRALDKIVTVSAPNAGEGGDFSIVVQFQPLPGEAPPNTTCQTALPVMSGDRLTGQDISQATMRPTSGCVGFGHSNELFYSITVPAGQTLTAVVTPVSEMPWTPVLNIFASCTASQCLASTLPGGRPGDAVPINYTNRTGATQTVILSVAAIEPNPTGTFDLAVDILPPAPNATCEGATPVGNGTLIAGENLARGSVGAASCAAQNGPALYYVATVPAGFAITARVRPDGPPGFEALVRILGACGSSCLAIASPGALHPDGRIAVTYVNTTGASQTVHIRVENLNANFPESSATAVPGFFDLEVAILPLAPNTSCGTARTVSNGEFLRNQSALVTDVTPLLICDANLTNPELFYRAIVPPGATLTAVEYPVTAFSPSVLLQTTCGGDSCLARSGSEFGHSSVAKYTNTTGASQEVFIIVGAAAFATPAPYTADVFFSIEPAPYIESSIAPACDDLSGAPVIVPVGGAPRVLPLPFSFPFFDTIVTRYAALPEGLAQLFANDGVIVNARTVLDNQPIPWPEPPNGFVAPFWQPLVGGSIHAALVDSPSPHFTIEWTDWRFTSFDLEEHLTFQVKLYEKSGVIEFHYCRLEIPPPSGLESGQVATVGIESLSGRSGVLHSYRTIGSVSTSQAIRFTPAF